ncbi:MAG: cobalamin-dependent protein [Nitrososphaerales archaeon]
MNQILDEIRECFTNLLGVDRIRELVKLALDSHVNPMDLIEAMKEGLEEVGKRYDEGSCFLSDLIMSGLMATELTNLVKPHLEVSNTKPKGKIVIGTVKGDIHDIGKNIVASMLSSQGFEVIDVGVDVSPESFLSYIQKYEPDILAMSCLLTIGMSEMQNTIRLVRGSNKKVKIMIGGRPITQEFSIEVGADGYGKDAFEAVRVAEKLVGEKNE